VTWRDQLRPASFRGVTFQVTESAVSGGRRLGAHEYIGRDEPFAEDMGGKGGRFPVQAFLVGEDVIEQARSLRAELDRAGPGTLVHPWRGEQTVAVDGYTETWSSKAGGYVGYDISFVATVEPRYPAAAFDAASAMDDAALAAAEAELAAMSAEFDWTVPDYAIEDAAGTTTSFADRAKATLGKAVTLGQTAARWARGISATTRDAMALARDPMALGSRIFGLMDVGNVAGSGSLVQTVIGLAGDARGLLSTAQGATLPDWRAWLPLADWAPALTPIRETTPARRQQAINRAVIIGMVRRGALVQASRVAARADHATYEDAIAARDALADRLDREQETAAPQVYRALAGVRASLVRAVAQSAPELPRLITVTPRTTEPAIVVAYRTFGSTPKTAMERAEQTVARNRIRHPLFVPGGQPVQLVALPQSARGVAR